MPTADLDTPYRVTADAVARFADEGFARLPAVFSREAIAAYEPEITGQVIELNTMHDPLAERDTYHQAFLQVENLWRHSEKVREFVSSARLARIAAELMGVTGVRLYHDQALYKEAGGGFTPWHADQYYWPLASDRTCTAWIPLQETPAEMGPLAFASGSHRFSYGRDLPIGDESEARLQEALAAEGFPVVDEPFELGEVSFHTGWTFHRAAPNRTGTPRRVMTVIYMDVGITVSEPVTMEQRRDLDMWMPGARPGEIPRTLLNPVLYQS